MDAVSVRNLVRAFNVYGNSYCVQVPKRHVYSYLFSILDNSTWSNELLVTYEEPNLFENPFGSTWIKVSASVAFSIGLITSAVLTLFFCYQAREMPDNQSTIINQLCSWSCIMVRIFSVFKIKHSF